MVSEGGSCDFDIEVGIDNAAIPASILRRWNALVNHRMKDYDVTYWCAFGLSPLRMYSAGTFASSGATAMIASRDTSRKGGRARIRGSWTVGVGIDLAWWWWWGANEVGWDATCNMTYDEEEESEELWTDYIEVAYVEIVSQPILGHSFMCGVSLGLACYVVSITHCTLCKRLCTPRSPSKNTFLVLSIQAQARMTRQPPVGHSILSKKIFATQHSPWPFSWVKAKEGDT